MEQFTEVSIKGMVCNRCKSVITNGITALGFNVKKVELGKVVLASTLQETDLLRINNFLLQKGFELLTDKKENY